MAVATECCRRKAVDNLDTQVPRSDRRRQNLDKVRRLAACHRSFVVADLGREREHLLRIRCHRRQEHSDNTPAPVPHRLAHLPNKPVDCSVDTTVHSDRRGLLWGKVVLLRCSMAMSQRRAPVRLHSIAVLVRSIVVRAVPTECSAASMIVPSLAQLRRLRALMPATIFWTLFSSSRSSPPCFWHSQ